jgi:hypothetical protein
LWKLSNENNFLGRCLSNGFNASAEEKEKKSAKGKLAGEFEKARKSLKNEIELDVNSH